MRIKLNHGTTTLTDNRQLVDMYLLHRPPVEFLKASLWAKIEQELIISSWDKFVKVASASGLKSICLDRHQFECAFLSLDRC